MSPEVRADPSPTDHRALVQALFHAQALRFGEFRLKLHQENPDAPLSPIYIDLRMVQSHVACRNFAIANLQRCCSKIPYDVLCGIPHGATPFAAILADCVQMPLVSLRPPKQHGISRSIDGDVKPGQRVCLIDDLITAGHSKFTAIDSLRAAGLIVEHVVVLVDREQGGVAALAEHGTQLHAVLTLTELLDAAVASGVVSAAKRADILAYVAAS
jgi:uridine monophosphate synthetase